MKTKYESIINAIARMMIEGKTETAKHHFNRAWKRYDDMTDIEKEVMDKYRYEFYGRPFENYDPEADYYENKILASQEDNWM